MAGKILGVLIVLVALIGGAALYYLQVYAFYDEIAGDGKTDVQLVPFASETPEPILYDNFTAIDSDSSPIRFRACFTTTESLALATETYMPYAPAIPRVAPGWFDCFDADAIAEDLKAGRALAFLGARNIRYGVDRVVVLTEDGRGYIWHELNTCTDPLAAQADRDAACPDD